MSFILLMTVIPKICNVNRAGAVTSDGIIYAKAGGTGKFDIAVIEKIVIFIFLKRTQERKFRLRATIARKFCFFLGITISLSQSIAR